MKIAVTYENGSVFQHFGHTEQFKLYDVEEGKVVSSQVVDTNGSGHGALAGFLADQQVDSLICGGIGPAPRWPWRKPGSGSTPAAPATLISGWPSCWPVPSPMRTMPLVLTTMTKAVIAAATTAVVSTAAAATPAATDFPVATVKQTSACNGRGLFSQIQ